MRIAMIGLRGVPAAYSGVETAVEEIGARLTAEGHEVTVFCMANCYRQQLSEHRGMRLVYVPTIRSKNLEMIVYSLLATMRAVFGPYDVIHFHAVGPSTMAFIAWLANRPSVATCHGLDYKREKWGLLARTYLRLGEFVSARFAREVIVVSQTLATHFVEVHGRSTRVIPNGAAPTAPLPLEDFGSRYGIAPGRYVLFVGRLVECKRVDLLISAFRSIVTDAKLVIVGDGPPEILSRLRSLAEGDDRIVLTGPLHGPALARVFSNAGLFALPSVLEGLPVALIEALSYGLPVLVSNIPENLEVVWDGVKHRATVVQADDAESLRRGLTRALDTLVSLQSEAQDAKAFISAKYNWDKIAAQTLDAYVSASPGEGRAGLRASS